MTLVCSLDAGVVAFLVWRLVKRINVGKRMRDDKAGEAFNVRKERNCISWAITPNLVKQVRQFV